MIAEPLEMFKKLEVNDKLFNSEQLLEHNLS